VASPDLTNAESAAQITYETLDEGRIARIWLNRADAQNAQSRTLLVQLDEAFGRAEADDTVRVVILAGRGKNFSAGHDLGSEAALLERKPGPDQHPTFRSHGSTRSGIAERTYLQEWHYFFENTRRWRDLRKITIAQVQGNAISAGLMLIWACDLIVAADDARFVMSYARVGLTPDGGGSWFLTRALPRALASEILLEAKPIGAVRLHDVGVVNRLTRRGTALDSAIAWADDLGSMSPKALARIKSLITSADVQPLAAHLDAERDSFVDALHHGDALEGISAFLEKRQPNYK